MSFSFIRNTSSSCSTPSDSICYGCQNDGSGLMWSAVAHTDDYGPIAGKANRTTCWYPYGGKEYETKNFSWLTAPEGKLVPVKNSGCPPSGAVCVGEQLNEGVPYFAAIAICDHGLIPGKAKGDTCWYSYGGKEIYTKDFMWLVSR